MKKEELLEIEGMTETLAEKVAAQSAKELESYVPKTQFDEAEEAKKKAEGLVKERDKQIEEVKKAAGDNEELKKQIEQLQSDNKAAKEKHEAEMHQIKIDNAVQNALKDAGAKNMTAVTALLKDLDKAELADDGTVKGLAEQIKALQESDAYMFEPKTGKQDRTPKGATPAGGTAQTPGAESSWAARLAEARKNNNQLEVIKIKQEAFSNDGIVLI